MVQSLVLPHLCCTLKVPCSWYGNRQAQEGDKEKKKKKKVDLERLGDEGGDGNYFHTRGIKTVRVE